MKLFLIIILIIIQVVAYGQVDTIIWQRQSVFPDSSLSASQMGYFIIDSFFYVAGGWAGEPGNTTKSSVWRYNINHNDWSQLGNLPFGGAATSCTFALNGKGYFLTARDSINNGDCDKMFWEYDPTLDNWTRKANFPDSPRQQSSCFTYGGKGYVGQTYGCVNWDTHFWQYDPISDIWSQVSALPTITSCGSVTVPTSNGSAYLFDGSDIGGHILRDIWRYNITDDHWDSIGQMPGLGRFFGVFWGLDSVIIGGGGEVSNNIDSTYLGNDFYVYNVSRNLWSPLVFKNFIDSVYYGASFIYDRTAYYFGGNIDLLGVSHNIGIWSFDASRFFPDSTVGIKEVKSDVSFFIYPNPVNREKGFSISTSESGEIVFSDELGRVVDERRLVRGD